MFINTENIMRKTLFALAATTLFLISCCHPTLVNTYLLTDFQKELVPYTLNDNLSFVNSEETAFSIKVTEVTTTKETLSQGVESCYYDEYEEKTAKLSSAYPDLDIEITTSAFHPEYYNDTLSLLIRMNYKSFRPQCTFDIPEYSFQDTVIGGHEFNNVLILHNCTDSENLADTTAIYFHSIVYSAANGIELITFNNGDYYELKK